MRFRSKAVIAEPDDGEPMPPADWPSRVGQMWEDGEDSFVVLGPPRGPRDDHCVCVEHPAAGLSRADRLLLVEWTAYPWDAPDASRTYKGWRRVL